MTPRQLKRFEEKYIAEPNSGCWLWMASVNKDGYARFSSHKTGHLAAFEHWNGKVPDGKEVDHKCDIKCCVNPSHLQAISHRDNVAKSGAWKFNTSKTHCPKGHPYTGDNLYMSGTNRQCNICRRARSLAFYRARKSNQMEAYHR